MPINLVSFHSLFLWKLNEIFNTVHTNITNSIENGEGRFFTKWARRLTLNKEK